MLGKISVLGFEPKTAKPGEEVKRKIELRDRIKNTVPNLGVIAAKCRQKKLSLTITFYLYAGETNDTSRYTKDLDNLLKIVLDVLPEYMDSEKKEVGLGLIESDRDDLVHEIHAKKEFVLDLRKEGVSLELFELGGPGEI